MSNSSRDDRVIEGATLPEVGINNATGRVCENCSLLNTVSLDGLTVPTTGSAVTNQNTIKR